jgi:hypothetical protein
MNAKAKSIVYWTTTILVAFFMSGGLSQIWQYRANPHGVVPELGYPMYFFAILGIWKALGADCHPGAGFSSAQGVGVRGHLLRPDRRGRVLRRCRRLRCLRLSRDCAADHHGIPDGFVVAEAAGPRRRSALSIEKRWAGVRLQPSARCSRFCFLCAFAVS